MYLEILQDAVQHEAYSLLHKVLLLVWSCHGKQKLDATLAAAAGQRFSVKTLSNSFRTSQGPILSPLESLTKLWKQGTRSTFSIEPVFTNGSSSRSR